jgi:hypothetical protein
MNREELLPWIERLNAEPDKKKHKDIVEELCKEKGLKPKEAWKLLSEAGYESKDQPGSGQADNGVGDQRVGGMGSEMNVPPNDPLGGDQAGSGQVGEGITILAHHNTPHEKYRRAGIVLSKKPDNYLVTTEQLEALKRDPLVTVKT